MKQGMIFTIDAIIALGIFLSSTLLFYSFFTEAGTMGLRSPNLYSSAENYFGSYDTNGISTEGGYALADYSYIFQLYQKNQTDDATETIKLIADSFDFPANAKLFVWNGTDFEKIIFAEEHFFEDKISIKRYLVFDFERNLETSQNLTDMNPVKILTGKNATYSFNLTNPVSSDSDVSVNLYFSNSTHNFSYIFPENINTTIPADSQKEFEFTISVPEDALIDTYLLTAETTGDFEDVSNTTASVIMLGLLEVETGYGY